MMHGRAIAACAGAGGAPPALTLPTTDLLAAWDARVGVTDAGAGRVSSWVDYHGSYDAVQATGADQPLLVAAALGGQDVISFNAAATERLVVAAITSAATVQTVYVVMTTTTPTAATIETIWLIETGQLGLQNQPTQLRFLDGAARVLATSQLNGTLLSCVVCDGVGTATHYRNGVADNAGIVYTPRAIGGRMSIGGLIASTSNAFGGDIAALFIYTEAHDATARAGVEAYIAQEWGV